MAGTIRNYYAGGNTARGFYSLLESNLQGLDRIFILKGGPGTGKSSLMKAIGEYGEQQHMDVEYMHNPSDNASIDGVIISQLKAAVVNGDAPYSIEPKAPGAAEEIVYLGSAWDSKLLEANREHIEQLSSQISDAFKQAYDGFSQALKVHDEWEEIYIKHMNFEQANELTNELKAIMFGQQKQDKQSTVRHRFLGAATPQGAHDFVGSLTGDISKRYLIKGRPGSGKSTMLKQLAAVGTQRGFDIEMYHCGFDPHSLDMVIFRELGLAIFDSTAPHEYELERETDEIVDMYKRTIEPGTDERYADKVREISGKYKTMMKEATGWLAKAKQLHDELETIYTAAMDFAKVDSIRTAILTELAELAERSVQLDEGDALKQC